MLDKTIAAISTPFGKGGIAVIRVSGDSAIEVASRAFLPKSGRSLDSVENARAVYGDIVNQTKHIDDGIAVVFRAPRSYTGEDVVEISCHGGVLVTAKVLEALFAAGAAPASAGEFTRRAFVNGKLSLSQAEAIGMIIDADSDEQLEIASAQEGGLLSRELASLGERLKLIITSCFAGIDFPDEDLALLSDAELDSGLSEIQLRLEELESSYEGVRAVTEGIRCAIIGRPNTGKSSLLNRLLGRNRAIVTDIAGTTRDTLEETARLGRVVLRLVDTAGIHATDDRVERLGVERSLEAMRSASLILAVFDGTETPCELSKLAALLDGASGVKVAVLNKSDLGTRVMSESLSGLGFSHSAAVSALTGEGIARLSELVESLFAGGEIDYSSRAVLLNARQNASVVRALGFIRSALERLRGGFSLDVVGVELESALAELELLDGRAVSEEIVDSIFHRFCVGK